MALEYLKKLFPANEDGTPKAMTFEELEAAITADKGISLRSRRIRPTLRNFRNRSRLRKATRRRSRT